MIGPVYGILEGVHFVRFASHKNHMLVNALKGYSGHAARKWSTFYVHFHCITDREDGRRANATDVLFRGLHCYQNRATEFDCYVFFSPKKTCHIFFEH